ncbi:MAG: transporter, permease protein [Flavipsychrobacter sp.]|nr:transporter, permease protein [Flavipsychrobacter sp.]
MDSVIQKKKWYKRPSVIGGIAAVVAAVLLFSHYFSSGNTKFNVNAGRITISETVKGPFKELIPVNGVVLPVTTIYLDAVEGGRVAEKYVEDGATLKKGDPIVKLANTDLELSLINEETSVYNLLTQMRISHHSAQQNTIAKLNQMAEVDNAYTEAERVYRANKQLYSQKVISTQEFKQSEQAYDYQVKRKQLTAQIMKQDSLSLQEDEDQTRQSYERTSKALKLMRKKVEDLIVCAPIDGRITSMDAEVGQSRNKGERLGQIDALNGFKIKAEVDEHYISRVFAGQVATCMVGDKEYKMEVKKIYTKVTSGRFSIDLDFTGETPKDIHRGQSLQVKLELSSEVMAVLIPKGSFYQQTGGLWIFKVTPDGRRAYKADIKLGRQNPDYYEVMEGLKPGERVVTSSYETYEKVQELVVEK